MIENARGMIEIESIAKSGKGYLDGLLVSSDQSASILYMMPAELIQFAAEDCKSH